MPGICGAPRPPVLHLQAPRRFSFEGSAMFTSVASWALLLAGGATTTIGLLNLRGLYRTNQSATVKAVDLMKVRSPWPLSPTSALSSPCPPLSPSSPDNDG